MISYLSLLSLVSFYDNKRCWGCTRHCCHYDAVHGQFFGILPAFPSLIPILRHTELMSFSRNLLRTSLLRQINRFRKMIYYANPPDITESPMKLSKYIFSTNLWRFFIQVYHHIFKVVFFPMIFQKEILEISIKHKQNIITKERYGIRQRQ